MKRTNKKGFTIVELVVVIAVIAILAAVLIPTFAGVTGKAKDAAFKSELKAAYSQYTSEKGTAQEVEDVAAVVYIKYDDKYYEVTNGNTDAVVKDEGIDIDDLCTDTTATGFVGGTVFEKAAAHVGIADCVCDYCETVVHQGTAVAGTEYCDVCQPTTNP